MPALDKARVFNKHVLNPFMLRLAGRKYWYASVIEHTGRRSGAQYATPVVADTVAGGFIVPLPYGTDVDWLRNVMAAGRATLLVHGERYTVAQPQVVDAAVAAPLLSPHRRRLFARFGIAHYLKVKLQQSNAA